MQADGAGEAPLEAAKARRGLSVFFIAGMLMAFPGAILPAWGYHILADFSRAGGYFLAMSAGLLVSVYSAPYLIHRKGISFSLVLGSGLASGAFLLLALFSPPASWWWRLGLVVLIGFCEGLISSAAFHSVAGIFRHNRAATTNLSGLLFVSGCFVVALLVSGTFYIYTVPSILILVAVLPGFAAGIYARPLNSAVALVREPPWQQVWADIRSPGAILFSLLLFFQFGNEWTLAGWLAIFLVQRIGVSPATALLMLAGYWLILLVGRIVAQFLLGRVRHGSLLLGSALSAMLGCLILISTNNRFGAWTSIVLLGIGFAPIYPLMLEKIGFRFPHYHPGLYHRLFTFAGLGGMLAPWSAGLFADSWGAQAIMAVPLLGSIMVFVLLILLWVESKLSGKP